MELDAHGPLNRRFLVLLVDGPFDGLTVGVSGCCAPPWLMYISNTSSGPCAWHPDDTAPDIEDVEEYMRDGVWAGPGIAQAMHLPRPERLADTA